MAVSGVVIDEIIPLFFYDSIVIRLACCSVSKEYGANFSPPVSPAGNEFAGSDDLGMRMAKRRDSDDVCRVCVVAVRQIGISRRLPLALWKQR